MNRELLRIEHLSSRRHTQRVLRSVSVDVQEGQCVALVANPLEKQCIIDILFYEARPDTGRIYIGGKRIAGNLKQGLDSGKVAYIGSHLRLLPSLSVSRNYLMYLKHSPGEFLVHDRKLRRQTEQLLEEFGLSDVISPDIRVDRLSFFHTFCLELLMVAEQGARLIVLNDLIDRVAENDIEELRRILLRLTERGMGFLILSNRYSDLFQRFDRVVIVHNGVSTGILRKGDISLSSFIQYFSPGTAALSNGYMENDSRKHAVPALELRSFRLPGDTADRILNARLYAGSALGIWSEDWNRIMRLGDAFFGNTPFTGNILLENMVLDRQIMKGSAAKGIALSVSVHSADKIYPEMSLYDNITCLAGKEIYNSLGMIRSRVQRYLALHMLELIHAEHLQEELGHRREVGEISGIDQLRIITAKWLCVNPKVFIFVNPFIALDDTTIYDFAALVRSLTEIGAGVLLLSVNREWLELCSDQVLTL